MDKNQINEALSYIDESIIEETQKVRENKKGPHITLGIRLVKTPAGRGILAAASLVLIVGIGALAFSQKNHGKKASKTAPESSMLLMFEDLDRSLAPDDFLAGNDAVMFSAPTTVPANAFDGSNSKETDETGQADTKSLIKTGSMLNASDYLFTSCTVEYDEDKCPVLNIEFELSKASPFYIRFDDAYRLQKLEGEEYVTVGEDVDVLINAFLHILTANDSSSIFTQKVYLAPYNDLLEPGQYRVTKEIYLVPDGFEGAEPIYYLVDFDFEICR